MGERLKEQLVLESQDKHFLMRMMQHMQDVPLQQQHSVDEQQQQQQQQSQPNSPGKADEKKL